jgi:hypothetical protein
VLVTLGARPPVSLSAGGAASAWEWSGFYANHSMLTIDVICKKKKKKKKKKRKF